MGELSFTRKERLNKRGLIKKVFDRGISTKGRLITIYLLKRDNGSRPNRAAFIVRRNLCNKKAVLRNRFRRLLREAYRKTKQILPAGLDIVILATNVKENTKSRILEEEIANVFKRHIKKQH